MKEDTPSPDIPARLRASVMETLADRFAAVANTAAAAVEPGHLVSGYLPDDPLVRHRFIVTLEQTFAIPIDGTRFDSARTVGELADLIALKIQARKATAPAGRAYVVCYRDAEGRLVETSVRARNHEQAVESLRAEGLCEVVSVERESDDGDDEPRAGRVRNAWTGCVLPILAAFVVAGGAIAFFWMRRG